MIDLGCTTDIIAFKGTAASMNIDFKCYIDSGIASAFIVDTDTKHIYGVSSLTDSAVY